MTRHTWTKAEDQALYLRYEHDDVRKIASDLGRTAQSIRRRSNRLGLFRDAVAVSRVLRQATNEAQKPDTTSYVESALAARPDVQRAMAGWAA